MFFFIAQLVGYDPPDLGFCDSLMLGTSSEQILTEMVEFCHGDFHGTSRKKSPTKQIQVT